LFSTKLGFTHKYVPGTRDWLTLLLLHGTGGDENEMLPLGRELAPGSSLLSPRGRVLENGMSRYFRRFNDRFFDYGDMREQTLALIDFIKTAAEEYGFDYRRVVAVGYSNGANMAGSVLLHNPYALKAAVLFRPMVPFTPIIPLKQEGKQVYISAGTNDEMVPRVETEQLERMLKKAGGNVVVKWTEAGHALTPEDIAGAKEWFQEHLGR